MEEEFYYSKNKKRNLLLKIFKGLTITNKLIILIIFTSLIFFILVGIFEEEKIFSLFALQPSGFFNGKIWTILTSMFIHGSIGHLLFNIISLFFIGNFVEKIIGRKRFIWFYLISGIFAGFFYVTLSYFFGNLCYLKLPLIGCLEEKIFLNPNVFAVGASGAIFALLGLLAILTPYNKVFLIAGPLIAIVIQSLISSFISSNLILSLLDLIITIYFVISIFSIFSFNPNIRKIALPLEMPFYLLPIIAIVPLMIIGLFIKLPIGNTAHLGGLIAGIIYANYLKKKYKKKTELIKRIFS